MYRQIRSLRSIDREEKLVRIAGSTSLAGKFPRLKSLKVELVYCRPADVCKEHRLTYEVNLTNAKSVFLFTCPDGECMQGDFDLSDTLARAIDRRQRQVAGEVFCQGWQNQITSGRLQCQNSLQYKFWLTYSSGKS